MVFSDRNSSICHSTQLKKKWKCSLTDTLKAYRQQKNYAKFWCSIPTSSYTRQEHNLKILWQIYKHRFSRSWTSQTQFELWRRTNTSVALTRRSPIWFWQWWRRCISDRRHSGSKRSRYLHRIKWWGARSDSKTKKRIEGSLICGQRWNYDLEKTTSFAVRTRKCNIVLRSPGVRSLCQQSWT